MSLEFEHCIYTFNGETSDGREASIDVVLEPVGHSDGTRLETTCKVYQYGHLVYSKFRPGVTALTYTLAKKIAAECLHWAKDDLK